MHDIKFLTSVFYLHLKAGRGMITRDWVDQLQILSHRAIGGFLSHCGWNSVIESISAGVPILAWPMIAEQSLNAKLVAEGLGAGLGIKIVKDHSGLLGYEVSREAICEGVRELMLRRQGKECKGESTSPGESSLACGSRRWILLSSPRQAY